MIHVQEDWRQQTQLADAIVYVDGGEQTGTMVGCGACPQYPLPAK